MMPLFAALVLAALAIVPLLRARRVARLSASLASLGFAAAGSHRVDGRRLHLWIHPHQGVQATLVEEKRGASWVELVSDYTDGSSFILANGESAGEASCPMQERHLLAQADATVLFRRMLVGRPRALLVSVTTPAQARDVLFARRSQAIEWSTAAEHATIVAARGGFAAPARQRSLTPRPPLH